MSWSLLVLSFVVFSALELMKDQGSRSSRSSLSGPDMTVQYLQGLGICYNFSIRSVFVLYTQCYQFFQAELGLNPQTTLF